MRRAALLSGLVLACFGCDDGDDDGVLSIPQDMAIEDIGILDMRVVDMGPPVDAMVIPDSGPDATPDVTVVDAQPDAMVVPACSDGEDNDGDGLADYPLDPGCSTTGDDDETDPATAECADGVDNDDDGRTDHPDDPGCVDPSDTGEVSQCDAEHGFTEVTGLARIEGDTTDGISVWNTCRNNVAPETVFLYTLRSPVAQLIFDTNGSSFDTMLGVRRVCDDGTSEIACNDDRSPGERFSEVKIDDPPLGDYFVIIDGHAAESGPFVLNIRAALADGEACADADPPSAVRCGPNSICREGLCSPAACSDGLDNDDDTKVDFPTDPGCESASDDDETDPEEAPQCADGADNDGDGLIDFPNDNDCDSAADPEEAPPPACRDGRDNDGDGLIDLADPGCDGDANSRSEYNPPECLNNIDDDEDGRTDYPNDPGCDDFRDPTEANPEVLPACADEMDNDEDGLTDYPEDAASCLSAADNTEDDACLRTEAREITGLTRTRGNTNDALNDFEGSCRSPSNKEDVLLWRVAPGRNLESLTLNTRDSDFDTVVYARNGCGGEELGCDDNSGTRGSSVLTVGPLAEGTELYIFIDSGPSSEGIWRLRLNPLLGVNAPCGEPGDWACGEGLQCVASPDGVNRCLRSICDNGIDDDDDGIVDFPDEPGCTAPSDNDETDPAVLPQCANGEDDDEDGTIDFGGDLGCDFAADDYEGPDCADGVDNDGDGLIDFDRDDDGRRGPSPDPQCVCPDDEDEEEQPDCSDNCDNDRDGLIDLDDPGCGGQADRNVEVNPPQCRDRVDNDENGHTDFPADPGCTIANGSAERSPDPLPACGDDVDNDEDGLTDYPDDPDCVAAADQNELPVCERPTANLPESGYAEGHTVNHLNLHSQAPGCGFAGNAPEAVFRVSVPYPAHVVAESTGSAFDTVIYFRSECAATTGCEDEEDEEEAPEEEDAPAERPAPPVDPPPPPPEPDAGVEEDAAPAPDVDAAIEEEDAAPAPEIDAAIEEDAAPAPEADANLEEDAALAPEEDAGIEEDAGPALEEDAGIEVDAAPLPVADAGVLADAAVDLDAGAEEDSGPAVDAALIEDAALPIPDAGDVCEPESTEVACNDNHFGNTSRADFEWEGGDLYLFLDGFGDQFGPYRLTVEITYPLGGQCGPELHGYARCEAGTECLPDAEQGFATCQAP